MKKKTTLIKRIKDISAIWYAIGILVVTVGMILTVRSHFATAEELAKTNLTIQQMKETYQLDKDIARFKFLDDEIFRLKEKYRNKVMPDETGLQIHKYEQEYKELERKLEK